MVMRNYQREKTNLYCCLVIDNKVIKAEMLDFSLKGACIRLDGAPRTDRYVSLVYQNEKNQWIEVISQVVRLAKGRFGYDVGLQFIGIRSRVSR